jgi:hypothetical protein
MMATTKRKGRPYKFDAKTRRRLVSVIAKGVPLTYAPGACGVSRSAFFEYRASHPRFEESVQKAIARAIERNLDRILTAAKNGDISSAKWFLEKCHAKFFSRQALELSGPDGEPLAVGVGIYLPQKDPPQPKAAVVTTEAS